MAGKISIILGSNAHLFPSADDDQFEELYQTRLKPFITVLNQFPKISAALHYSGFLFNRLEQKKPELFLLIKEMAARKQLELLGGGFYEPIMPLLPPADRIGQIEMLTTYIRQNFGRKPQGCMLYFSVWEQPLALMLAASGMDYTFLSEAQFAAAGCRGKNLLSPVYTEDQGKLLMVFPVFSSLAPMGTNGVWATLQKARINPPEGGTALVTVFPDFSKENAEENIRSFFSDLAAVTSEKPDNTQIEVTTPGRVYRSAPLLKRVYFLASGDTNCPQPRSSLSGSPGANELYARLQLVHNLINQLRGDKSRKRSAREELWKAEGAETLLCAGNREVRRYAQKAILAAERIIREKDFKPSLLSFDFDFDRVEEFLFQDKNINCYVKARGASVFELDYIPKGWNYLDSSDAVRGKRSAFTDILAPGDFIPPPDFRSAVYTYPGKYNLTQAALPDTPLFPDNCRFCGDEEYRLLSADRVKLKASFSLSPRKGIPFGFIEIQKTYSLEKNMLNLAYKLTNTGDEKTVLCFIPRFDLALAGGELIFRKSQGEEERSADKTSAKRRVVSFEESSSKHGAAVGVGFQTPCDLYYADLEEFFQTWTFLPLFQVFLNPGDSWENRITVSISAKARKS